MIIFILLLLIMFSVVFAGIWYWFFKKEEISSKNFYQKGMRAFNKQKYFQAREYFSQAFALDSKYPDAEYMLGMSLFRAGDLEGAKERFENILNNAPNDFKALFSTAQILQKELNYDTAEDFYNKALAVNQDYESYLNLGIIRYRQQDYVNALEFFNKASLLKSQDKQASYYRVMCRGELCDFEREKIYRNIIKDYVKISGKNDLPKDFSISLARAYAKAGEANKALMACKKVLTIDSENVEVYKLLGLIQLVRKDFTESKTALSMALNLQPKDKEIYEILSYLLCQQKDSCDRQKCREKYYEMIKKFL